MCSVLPDAPDELLEMVTIANPFELQYLIHDTPDVLNGIDIRRVSRPFSLIPIDIYIFSQPCLNQVHVQNSAVRPAILWGLVAYSQRGLLGIVKSNSGPSVQKLLKQVSGGTLRVWKTL